MAQGQEYEVEQVGVFTPKPVPVDELGVGEVGFITAGIKKVSDAQIGDTITEAARPATEPFPGLPELKPMVFAGLYPVEGHEYPELRDALEKLRLNDASFFYEPETSAALGFGFRCGFLGLLHMEIVQERLEREFDQDLVTTAPGRALPRHDDRRRGPRDRQPGEAARSGPHPDVRGAGHHGDDPDARRSTSAPSCSSARRSAASRSRSSTWPSDRVLITYELPFNEVVLDFYDKLKTISRGYASLDYHVTGYWESPLVKLDILVNGDPVDALSIIVHRDSAYAARPGARRARCASSSRGRCSRSRSRRRSAAASSPASR